MIIYKTINLINGKIYIGQDRYNNPKYYGSGIILRQSIKKYGKENFKKEIIDYCSTISELNTKEKYWIEYYHSYEKEIGYNLTKGGTGGALVGESLEKMTSALKGRKLSKEHKEKISKSLKDKNKGYKNGQYHKKPWNKGLTKQNSQKMLDISIKSAFKNKGRKQSQEERNKRSLSMKGKNTKVKSDNHKQKISETLKGRKLSIETKEKMSKSRKGKKQKILECPNCGKLGGTTMYRWHFNNCKFALQ